MFMEQIWVLSTRVIFTTAQKQRRVKFPATTYTTAVRWYCS